MRREKALGSFSFDVAKRMLDVLIENGISMKKTNLASKAGLNYNVCLRYIRILNNLGWVEANSEVSITEIGRGIFTKLLDDDSSARASTPLTAMAGQATCERKVSNTFGPPTYHINNSD